MVSRIFPLPLFWDLMGLFVVGLVGWVITWHISRGLAWFASAVGAGIVSAILLLAILFQFAGATSIDPLDDLFYTMLFWLTLHLISTLAFLQRIRRQSEQEKALQPEETPAGHIPSPTGDSALAEELVAMPIH